MRRRKFVSLLGGAIAWPIVARAQQGERRIGMLVNGSEADAEVAAHVATFRKTLQDFGWVPGTNLSNFVRIGSGEKFDPHITIGVATIPYQKKMLAEPFDAFTFSPAGVSV